MPNRIVIALIYMLAVHAVAGEAELTGTATELKRHLDAMPGQVTTTSPYGRDTASAGHPMRMCELLSTLRTKAYVVRTGVHTPQLMVQTKQIIRRAFELQLEKRCFTFVEVLSTCPTNWGMTPIKSLDWLQKNMVPYYPMGIFRDPDINDGTPAQIPIPATKRLGANDAR